jgi:hypothetical protein
MLKIAFVLIASLPLVVNAVPQPPAPAAGKPSTNKITITNKNVDSFFVQIIDNPSLPKDACAVHVTAKTQIWVMENNNGVVRSFELLPSMQLLLTEKNKGAVYTIMDHTHQYIFTACK